MPYFIYRVLPFAQLEKLADFDAFATASAHAKALRAAEREAPAGKIKVMFADSEQMAEDLLCQIRDPGPSGDD
jgi:hypothetical protein